MSNFNISLPNLKAQVSARVNRQSSIANRQCIGGGEGIRTPDPRVANAVLCQLSYAPISISDWLRGRDLNPRPLGYEPNELPDCSTPRQVPTQLTKTMNSMTNSESPMANLKLAI